MHFLCKLTDLATSFSQKDLIWISHLKWSIELLWISRFHVFAFAWNWKAVAQRESREKGRAITHVLLAWRMQSFACKKIANGHACFTKHVNYWEKLEWYYDILSSKYNTPTEEQRVDNQSVVLELIQAKYKFLSKWRAFQSTPFIRQNLSSVILKTLSDWLSRHGLFLNFVGLIVTSRSNISKAKKKYDSL